MGGGACLGRTRRDRPYTKSKPAVFLGGTKRDLCLDQCFRKENRLQAVVEAAPVSLPAVHCGFPRSHQRGICCPGNAEAAGVEPRGLWVRSGSFFWGIPPLPTAEQSGPGAGRSTAMDCRNHGRVGG